jgi:excisionase family DNA binding protein
VDHLTEPGYFSVAAAAKYSSLSVRTIRAMLARDTLDALPCRRVGRKILISRRELEQYLDARRTCGRVGVLNALRAAGLAS